MRRLGLIGLALLLAGGLSAQAQVLASGQFPLGFTSGPGSPNFNSAITLAGTVPADLGPTAGGRLVLSLRDVGRPDQFCDPDDPSGGLFDGCATVDWPFPGRRGINLVRLELADGVQDFHLRMDDTFSAIPEPDGP
ncbi:MAG: hypothetical protein AAF604_06675 [Acidobacteriota bacterium]